MRHEALKADGNQNGNSNLARARTWSTAVQAHRRREMPTSRWRIRWTRRPWSKEVLAKEGRRLRTNRRKTSKSS
eukprot:2938319-Heterocapsa_arctica.AAC.1